MRFRELFPKRVFVIIFALCFLALFDSSTASPNPRLRRGGPVSYRSKNRSAVRKNRDFKKPASFSAKVDDLVFVDVVVPEEVNLTRIHKEDQETDRMGGPYRFAVRKPVKVDVTTGGIWEQIDSETWMWRLHIVSPGATSLSLGFTDYDMPAGGKLFIYSQDGSEVLGPFTEQDNAKHGQLWTPLIHSDDVVLELNVPLSEAGKVKLTLGTINHGYRKIPSKQTPDKASGWCEIDVNCPTGDDWRDQIRSVATYYFTRADGTYLCSGAMINNTSEDNTPLFLTAFHCFDEYGDGVLSNPEGVAASMVVTWNYQAVSCGGPDIEPTQQQTGAYFRAGYLNTDVVLVELDEMPPCESDVYFAGWDRDNTAPLGAAAIHHPQGDIKKISIEEQPLSVTSYGAFSSPGDGTHLRIEDWDIGTTEGGSSGSPIFDSAKRIRGQLHGGYAFCGNDLSDWYGFFSVSWTGGATPSTSLSEWLDPLGTGVTALDGKDFTGICTYCSASAETCDEYISRVSVGGIDKSSGCSGYADYTAISTDMQKGQTQSITITNGRPYAGDQCGVWIDWNQDGDFSDANEMISIIGGPSIFTAIITSPDTATEGGARMRIRITYDGSLNPCGNTTYGEVEDYTINVVPLPQIVSWKSAALHGGADILYPVENGYVESRENGIKKLRVCFNTDMDTSFDDISQAVIIEGVNGGTQAVTGAIVWESSTCMLIELDSALPDGDAYTITLTNALKSAAGVELENTSICMTALKGDANGDRYATAGDLLAIRAHNNQPIDDSNARYDINCDGFITAGDLLAARVFILAQSQAPDCP